jgi:hypothetical protein
LGNATISARTSAKTARRSARKGSFPRIESAVAAVEQLARRVVDVQQHRVKTPTRRGGIEAARRIGGEDEEVTLDQTTAGIGSEFATQRHKTVAMPADHRGHAVHHEQFANPRFPQGRRRGVAQAETADDDVEFVALRLGESEIGECLFDDVKEARHEEFVAQLHLQNFEVVE